MAKSSKKGKSYIERSRQLHWSDLRRLWRQIASERTPGWDEGKALEHLVVRAFELGGHDVEYPYEVPPAGTAVEQIDGIVYWQNLAFLIECKDKERNDVGVAAKVRHQLERRPSTTFGCIFVAGSFTPSALLLTDITPPQRIVLWQATDIDDGLRLEDFGSVLLKKYRHLCRFGMTDYSPFYRSLEVK